MAVLTFPTPTQLKNLLGPTDPTDAATKAYVDNNLGSGNFGNINFNNSNIFSNIANSDINIAGNGTGNFTITANAKSWTFDNTGDILLPTNTFAVKYANGVGTNIANANYANSTGQLVSGAQPNITDVGILDNANVIGDLTVYGNANIQGGSSNLNIGNTTTDNLVLYLANNQTGFSVDKAGVSVGNAVVAKFEYDYSNTSWHSSVNLKSNSNISGSNLSTSGTTVAASFTVSDKSSLNDISNVKIFGGTNGQALISDGNGGLSWYTRPSPANTMFVNNGNSNLYVTTSGGNITVSSNSVANVLTVNSSGAVTSQVTQANSVVANSDIVISSYSGAARGGQLTLAYAGQTITGYGSNGSWSFGVDGSNVLSLFGKAADGTSKTYLSIPSSFNNYVTNGNFVITGNLSGPLFNGASNGSISGNVSSSNVKANTNINIGDTLTSTMIVANNNNNGTNFKVGDDAWIGDINQADTLRIKGQQNSNNGYVVFGNGNTNKLGRAGTGPLNYEGTFRASGAVGAGDKLYANGYGMILNSSSGASEGAQMVLAYAGTSGVTSQTNSTWNMDVDGSNIFRVYTQKADSNVNGQRWLYQDRRVAGLASLKGGAVINKAPFNEVVVDGLKFGVLNSTIIPTTYKLHVYRPGTATARSVSWGTVTISDGISSNNGNNVSLTTDQVSATTIGDNLWNAYGSVSICVITDLSNNRTYRVIAARVDNYSGTTMADLRFTIIIQRLI